MLISKKPEAGDIVVFKLVTGEEVIAKLKSDNGQALVVSKPIAIGMTQNGLAFMPFMVGAEEDVEMVFANNMVVTTVAARQELKDAYIQNTTGIAPASGLPGGLVQG